MDSRTHGALAEVDAGRPESGIRNIHVLRWQAASSEQLAARRQGIRAALASDRRLSLESLQSELTRLDADGAWRAFLVCRDRDDALDILERGDAAEVLEGMAGGAPRRPIFMFPGLGDHHVGMGRQLHDRCPAFRAALDECSALLQPLLGVDVREVLFPGGDAGPAAPGGKIDLRRMLGRVAPDADADGARLNRTEYAQPALFSVEYALAAQLLAWGIAPAAVMGYSLGEYVAACVSGIMRLEDALVLVARRARMIQELPEGGMLAVTLSEEGVRPFVTDGVSLSAIGGAALTVLAGPVGAVERAERRITGAGHVCRRLPTTHAFHSDMMLPLSDELTALVRSRTRHAPSIPCLSNVTGSWVTGALALDDGYWSRHMCLPVRFADGVAAAGSLGDHPFLEVGPGQTLTSLVMQHPSVRPTSRHHVVPCMRHAYDAQPDTKVLLRAVGRAWLAGAAVDWKAMEGETAAGDHPTLSRALSGGEAGAAAEVLSPKQPSDAPEKILALCRKVLKQPGLSASDSIFEAGANSLVATQLIFEIRKLFKVDLRLRKIYAAPTPARIAALVEAQGAPSAIQGAAAAADGEDGAIEMASSPFKLPNGLAIEHFNEVETAHFYEDIFEHRGYLKHGITLGDGACVLDVGANIGLFSLFILSEFPDARVLAFEPAPPNYGLLCKNTHPYRDRFQPFNLGLSDSAREATFTFYPFSTGMSSFHGDRREEQDVLLGIMRNQIKRGEKQIEELIPRFDELSEQRFASRTFVCNLATLSSIVEQHAIERIDLVKIDVQKAEMEVLRGIEERHWPRIRQVVVEVHDLRGQKDQVVDLLRGHGFDVHVEQDDLYQGTVIHNVYAIRAGAR